MHRAGFVNIIGSPNVGKSTLVNRFLGDKLSIITPKAQTTRHRILGILNEPDYQIVFSDLPGIVDPAYQLHKSMMSFVNQALIDADVFVVMTEPGEKRFKNEKIREKIIGSDVPVIVAINKIDLTDQDMLEKLVDFWEEQFPGAEVVPVSALHGFNLDTLMGLIKEKLPESPAFFPKDQFTDRTERFITAEIIREKILITYKKEVPYSVEVVVTEFKRDKKKGLIRIRAEIIVERESQKGIILGKGGSKLKIVGTEARKDIEKFFDEKVYLELFVKVDKNWRNNLLKLKKYGYEK